jgi:hypothetical protein
MEGMIRKLLVQQQEADSTIAELSDALHRLEPSELDRVDLDEMVRGNREEKLKQAQQGKKFGVQHLNGSPHQGTNAHVSPWHIDSKKQDIAQAIHPGEYTQRTNDKSLLRTLAGKQTKSLVAPGSLFNVTASPNNNPADILRYTEKPRKAPKVPQHLDSKVIKESITKWGNEEQVDAWEKSSDRWHTHSEEVHGYSNFSQGKGGTKPNSKAPRIGSRPSSAASRRHEATPGGRKARPGSALSRARAPSRGSRFGDTDPELKANPHLWTGSGYTKEVYDKLGAQGAEMHGRVSRDPEIMPGASRFN